MADCKNIVDRIPAQVEILNPQAESEAEVLARNVLADIYATDTERALAHTLLCALKTTAVLRRAADPMGQRFTTACPFPDLVAEELGHLWRQPNPGEHRYNTWQPRLVTAVKRWLKTQEKPADENAAVNAIRNKVFAKDWGWLVQRWDEGQPSTPVAAERSRSHAAAPFGVPLDGGLDYWAQVQNRQTTQNGL